jgi:hypothetical protein
MKRMIIPALAFTVLNGTMQAMEKIMELIVSEVPSIIQPSKLTEEQKERMLPAYKAFCERKFAESVESAKWYGVPAAILSFNSVMYGHRLMKEAYKEILKREAHDAAQPSMNRVRKMFRRLTPSSKILFGSPLIGFGYGIALYGATYGKDLIERATKNRCVHEENDLIYLNEDLYEQIGKPRVLSCADKNWQREQKDGLLWRMTYRNGISSRDINFLSEDDLKAALNRELEASHITVPLPHCHAF